MDVYQDDRERNIIPCNYLNPTLVYDYLIISVFWVFFWYSFLNTLKGTKLREVTTCHQKKKLFSLGNVRNERNERLYKQHHLLFS